MSELEALREANFEWVTRLGDVWSDSVFDVPDLHESLRRDISRQLEAMGRDREVGSPLGWAVVGPGGSGKTHLLGAFRRAAVQAKAAFILVDMTDVQDFWETVRQGYIDSLQQRYLGESYQYQCLLENLIERLPRKQPTADILAILAGKRSHTLGHDIHNVLNVLFKLHRSETNEFQDTIRALICLNSQEYTISNLGMSWLLGQPVEDEELRPLGFRKRQAVPLDVIRALSWFMSLSGPTVLAFDQIDPIVTQLHFKTYDDRSQAEQASARAIIGQIGSGLGTLRDATRNTLSIVSCLESSWEILKGTALQTYLDRFEPPIRLTGMNSRESAEAIVRSRLAPAFRLHQLTPEYPTWPFRPALFDSVKLDSPRELLKKCKDHVRRCQRERRVIEIERFEAQDSAPTPPVSGSEELDRLFEQHRLECDVPHLLEERHEDERLAPLLRSALSCLLKEHDLPDHIGASVDTGFTGGATTCPLHARLRLIFQDQQEREEHFCVRAIQHTNAIAFQNRLKAAMTQSGIDRALSFRHLAVLRTVPEPGGPATQKLIARFTGAGGRFVTLTESELRTMAAVDRLMRDGATDLDAWLHARQPVSKLAMMCEIVPSDWFFPVSVPRDPSLGKDDQNNIPARTSNGAMPSTGDQTRPDLQSPPDPVATAAKVSEPFPLGNRLTAHKIGEPLTMPISLLEKHTVVLAGAGSGKTVLLRRLVEEAVLRGVPAIVIDGANDLVSLDRVWPSPPDGWQADDPGRADRYFQALDMVLWTPGREHGHPLSFEPIPDFRPVRDDPDEFEGAVAMVRESLIPVVASGESQAARTKAGILSRALRCFAELPVSGTLTDFVDFLADLPADAGLGVEKESKLARQMADVLRSAIETNPLLRSSGTALDPAILFGDNRPVAGKTRVSVINLIGLPSLEAQRSFLNQLAMTLFTWIKRHPDPGPRRLRGLLVIDEAKDFVPSVRASTCKESLIRLTAQARKYHLGLVFATQNPKDLDNKIIANCSTHYYGKVNAPAAIETVRSLIALKGGSGDDIPRLERGQFYVHNADLGLAAPVRVSVPLCLSCHAGPLEEGTILSQAIAARDRFSRG